MRRLVNKIVCAISFIAIGITSFNCLAKPSQSQQNKKEEKVVSKEVNKDEINYSKSFTNLVFNGCEILVKKAERKDARFGFKVNDLIMYTFTKDSVYFYLSSNVNTTLEVFINKSEYDDFEKELMRRREICSLSPIKFKQ